MTGHNFFAWQSKSDSLLMPNLEDDSGLNGPVLQALSKRVHYGKFVAEAKFLEQRAKYSELIERQDSAAIMKLLTNKTVEKQARQLTLQIRLVSGLKYGFDGL